MMLSAHGGEGSDYGGSYDDYDEEEEEEWTEYEEEDGVGALPDGEDEEVGDAEGGEVEPAGYEDDEAYARALQDAEEREVAQRLMALAGITDCECTRDRVFEIQSCFLPLRVWDVD